MPSGDDNERDRTPQSHPRHRGPVDLPDRARDGWRRSDDRICEDVNVALMSDPGLDAGDIEVRVQDCEVTLTGTVVDKFARRMAEDIAVSVFGVTDVQNLLRVKRDRDGTEASSGRRGDVEVTRRPERDGGMTATPKPGVPHKKLPGSPDMLAD